MTQQAPPKTDKPKEQLKRMSFGDHLDELRRRLVICFAAMFVSAGVMFAIKDEVTAVYTQPYDFTWVMAYQDFLDKIEADFLSEVGPKDPEVRMKAAEYLTRDNVKTILAGELTPPGDLRRLTGYEKPYPQKSDPGWVAFVDDFSTYADDLRASRDGIERYLWHLDRREQILSGKYKYPSKIFSEGDFLLKRSLVAMGGLEDFWTFMAAVILFSAIAVSPLLLYHAWAFVAAGLYQNERKVVYRALPLAVVLLMLGMAFGYFIMVPYGLYFLTRLMDWTAVAPMFSVGQYFKFFFTLTVALGVVFQLPIAMRALHRVGILKLAMVIKHWRITVLSFFVISAMLTPPDPVTQMLMVTPMLTLFLLGLFLMWNADRKERAAAAAGEAKAS